ncbi:uncharacterized protein LOC116322140 isoform X1 [Oreochromis aureus]|uniref:uncharacterized protein LOC116322140 isoform X1 n=1 Tax=Oreochromis aureus TaxID=47969 RepID=UPI001953B23F|nr:uncharacterized protein LOC116322140 isoform X1 [Oreochromis aureus]XP_039466454.1 uncharacterized protein LOC116322140 isoform X1 [Oreochromis aureus]XP_039466455.1 uncharacterized protein LOC116322140 isoform X1 [Oreochromis aureus]XP_039466456.1 uncharacterized protein LOC116322140 isoform X1 [Oreochromis aureus]XP_039466457.1 uncharacterized protein LOC116322140 isoform X1 [Oreochromis aureus]
MDFMPFFMVPLSTFILHLGSVKGSFVVNVTQSSYQAEENHNITLKWTFTTKPDTSISALKILCRLITDQKYWTLYYLLHGVEFSESQDEKFSGRVQSDKDALREGRIRLQLSRLRTEDSGLYLCEVDTGYGRGYNSCRVTVSDPNFAKTSTTETSLQTPDHQDTSPANAGRSRVPVVIPVIAFIIVIAVAGLAVHFCCQHQNRTKHPEEDETQKQSLPV